MIKVMNVTSRNIAEFKAVVSLFADTKDEVVPGATIIGLPQCFTVDFGSSCITAEGDIGFMKSTGEWSWVE